jgi:hypothetical protein
MGFSSNTVLADDEPKSAGSEEAASKEAKGGLSAGAIAAAVAAAAAIAAASDSDSKAPAPTPAPPAPTPPAPTPPAPTPPAPTPPAPTPPAPTPAPTVIEEYNVVNKAVVAVATYTNTITNSVVTATATREVAAVPEVTGVSTSTSTSSATSTSGGVVTDYRYALRAEAGPDSSWAAANPLTDGEYYTAASDYNGTGQDADGNDVVYVSLDDAIASETVVVTPGQDATSEEYEVDVTVPVVVTLPDTIYEEQTISTTVATRTKLAN